MKLRFYDYAKRTLQSQQGYLTNNTRRFVGVAVLACASVLVGAMTLAHFTNEDNFVSSTLKKVTEKTTPSVKSVKNEASVSEEMTNVAEASAKTEAAPPPPPCTNCCNLVRNGAMDGNYGWTSNGGWSSGLVGNDPSNNLYLAQTIKSLNSGPIANQVTLTFDIGGGNWANNGWATLDISLNGTVYATFNNPAYGTTVTGAVSNGATLGNFTPFNTTNNNQIYRTGVTLTIPWVSKPDAAELRFNFNANIDDFVVDNLSITGTCPANNTSPGGATALTDLAYWIKADADAYTTASGNITDWRDQSPNEKYMKYLNSDPALIQGSINFNPAVKFDGDDYLRTDYGGGTTNFTSNYSQGEVFTVTKAQSTTFNHGNAYDFGGTYNSHYTWGNEYIYNDFGTTIRKAWNPLDKTVAEGGGFTTGPSVDVTKFNIFNTYSAPNDWKAAFNGNTAYTSTTNTVSFAANAGGNHIGAISGYSYYGDIAEVMLFKRKLTATERQKVNSYLAIKYGITLTQNYIASDGTTVFTANGGTANVLFFWMKPAATVPSETA